MAQIGTDNQLERPAPCLGLKARAIPAQGWRTEPAGEDRLPWVTVPTIIYIPSPGFRGKVAAGRMGAVKSTNQQGGKDPPAHL